MRSHEVMKKVFSELGVKNIAGEMKISPSLLYKWSEEREGDEAAGTKNPLDRVSEICRLTGDTTPLNWLCQQSGGYFVKNPSGEQKVEEHPLKAVQKILRDFSQLLEVVSISIEDDDLIDDDEATKIRDEWEDLKSKTESFVRACEHGNFA